MAGQAQRATSTRNGKSLAELRKENAKLKEQLTQKAAALDDALEQQTATSGVLRLISGSPSDVQPTFDAIVASAAKLCQAEFSAVARFEDGLLHLVATNNLSKKEASAFHSLFPRPALPNFVMGRAFVEAAPAQFEDVLADPNYDARTRQVLQTALGYRTFMAVPIFQAGTPTGVIGCARRRVEPFTTTQIQLLQTFADQAAIALDNVRLFNELGTRNRDLLEALEYQTATSDVLKVISRSTFDLQPVLGTLSETAARLCAAELAFMTRHDGHAYRFVTAVGSTPETAADAIRLKETVLDRHSFVAGRGSITGRVISEAQVVQIPDLASDPEYTLNELITIGGIRTLLGVPLLREGAVIGTMSLGRQRVEPFTQRQIELVRTFADQAVIAIENARLLGELRERTNDLQEALEYQTATTNVLKVISRSTFDLQPVLHTLAETALRLCEAEQAYILRREGEVYRAAAAVGASPDSAAAATEYQTYLEAHPISPGRGTLTGRVVLEGHAVHIADVAADPEYMLSQAITLGNIHTQLGVPLLREGSPIGVIILSRQRVQPFTGRQIELVRTFADQAVIAMENTRLITETREALEQQTATAEVLGIINSSPGDLKPVFESILEKAHALCGVELGSLQLYENHRFRAVAVHGLTQQLGDNLKQGYTPSRTLPNYKLLEGEPFVQVRDLAEIDDPMARKVVELGGTRTHLFVALRRDDLLLGQIVAARREVRPFTDRQISLLQNFAAQAVIAIENARLIIETREALEQQTATAEVLRVINSSPGDLRPVFDAMLEKALHLCSAAFGVLQVNDGDRFRTVATRGVPPAYTEHRKHNAFVEGPGSLGARIRAGQSVVHVLDLKDDEPYRAGDSNRVPLVDLGGARTGLAVPLTTERGLLGFVIIYRQEVRAFTEKQIRLLQNFAAQAVIAMENARLITETREALEQQTATAEVLGVINASPGDLTPVFDAMLEKAHTLCGVEFGSLQILHGDEVRAVAARGLPESFVERLRQGFRPEANHPIHGLLAGDRIIQLDMAELDNAIGRAAFKLGGMRTVLFVPLRQDDVLLGYITAGRPHVRAFSEKEIALLENFAAQAVIAMENARLITETREALDQQTATAEVLQVINASPGDLAPVFDAMLDKAMRLCEAAFGIANIYDGERFHTVALRGVPRALAELWLSNPPPPGPESPLVQILNGKDVAHIVDFATLPGPRPRAMVELGGAHSYVVVALRKDGRLLGTLGAYRQEVRSFTEKQTALLQNFAAQAVIAMENARLITETREALEQQTATAEVLGVINSSPGDLAPVFEAILEKAHILCGAVQGAMYLCDGDHFFAVAQRGHDEQFATRLREGFRGFETPTSQPLIRGERFVHIPDLAQLGHPVARAGVELAGTRTLLSVPLRRGDALLGMIVAARREVRPFSEKEIALLENFAAQSVIAMENARLLTETREALEQQTATAEVLGVINASPGDLGPVFNAMLEKAMHLCEAAFGQLATYDGGRFHTAATRGVPAAFAEYRRNNPPNYGPGTTPARILAGERVICTEDLKAEAAYQWGEPNRKALVDLGGARSAVIVPLRKEDEVLGFIQIYRQEVRAFSNKQIALLENFAAQAVIAMENARLLDEIRQRQSELRATFDNMGDGVVMFDENLRLAAWNRNFQAMLDLPDSVLAGRPSYADYLRLLAERGEFGTVDVEAELNRRLEHLEQEFRQERTRPDGRVIEVRRNAVPDGGFVLIYSDITERKRSEAEIRAARDQAEAAYRDLKAAQASLVQAEKMASLGQLTAGIAHEIKNPLNFVNNFAGLSIELLDELKEVTAPAIATLDEDKRAEVDETIDLLTSNLEKIGEHGRRADGIVKSMLEHSRGATGERRSVDLNALVDEALNLAYHGGRAQDQSFNITLERDYARDLAPIDLVPQDITRACLNLFGNGFYAATKRQKEGGDPKYKPTLKVVTRDLGDAVEIRARDNGVGIPPDIRDKLFQPFFTTKPTGEGTGLGLSISYDIVTQQHGGTIQVDSKVGEFTEFTVRLPRRRMPRAAAS